MTDDIESYDQGGEDQDMTWLDGPAVSMKASRRLWSDGPRGGEA